VVQYRDVIKQLKAQANVDNVAGMARFGISTESTLGVSIPFLRQLAKQIGTDHQLALKLWDGGIHEARILASMIADRAEVNKSMMDRWAGDFDSWDVCDQICSNLFRHTPYAWDKAVQWSGRKPAFVKRAGFVLMAGLAVADKQVDDKRFVPFLELIESAASDERHFVKKAVSWALRQLGKRSLYLHKKAVAAAKRIQKQESKAAQWVAKDALNELSSERLLARLS